jgi:hypothetical protein
VAALGATTPLDEAIGAELAKVVAELAEGVVGVGEAVPGIVVVAKVETVGAGSAAGAEHATSTLHSSRCRARGT